MSAPILRSYTAADHDWLVAQHQAHYSAVEGFDDTFEPLVSEILTAFEADHDPAREAGWIAEASGQPQGSIFCVNLTQSTAKLRLFYLVAEARGTGLGKRLLQTCMRFAKEAGYSDMTLWTHESHAAAGALYRAQGWKLDSSTPVQSFGQDLVEQMWSIRL
jgi:GNAT superfamily N-acetyltransferase